MPGLTRSLVGADTSHTSPDLLRLGQAAFRPPRHHALRYLGVLRC